MPQHLHLKFAVNLETLADEMIDEISKAWTSPFDAPVVIFSEYKLEQWFRLHWIEKKSVLANLNRKSLDRFLMDILVGDDPTKKKLSSDMLRNVILAYLQKSGEDGVPNYRTLDARVSEYLMDPLSGLVDENRLFDFANKLSGLFLEYETSRPSGFLNGVDGFLDCWKQGALKDFFLDSKGNPVENESWERKLYAAIFHNENGDSLLTKVFKAAGNPENPVEYLTLPFLYHMNCLDGKMKFHYDSKKPVFILGLAGMGQFYRVVLQEFAKEHEVYAYIQNPCMEFWEDIENPHVKRSLAPTYSVALDPAFDAEEDVAENENSLLVNWGRAGRDNIKLWSLADDYAQGFDDAVTSLYQKEKNATPDTLLHEVQWMIAHRTNQFSEGFVLNPDDPSLTITAAPSKIREVEAVHSQICKLLENGADVRDILVVAPKMADYRTAIYQVFDQSEKTTPNGIHVRFVILDSAQKKSLLGEALEVLFAIRKKGALCREDFFTLVRNPIVQTVKKISSEDISKWEVWVNDMNVYRDHVAKSNAKEDWLCGVHRLLLARLSDSIVWGGDEEFLPYANIDSEGKASLNHFADIVLSLENWIKKTKKPLVQNEDDSFTTASFLEFLNDFFLMQNVPVGLAGESIIYNKVIQAVNELDYQFATGISEISWNIVAQTVQCAAMAAEYSCGNLFVGGISFMQFAPNRTIPVKHLFFLGANAKDFPGSKSFDTLDLRKSVARWPGDDTPVEKKRYAFLCQLMSTSESLHISYQNMYLPKDQELFPSSVVNDLRIFLKKAVNDPSVKILPEQKISIDENRAESELYTERELRNKKTVELFNDGSDVRNFLDGVPDKTEDVSKKLPERVSSYSVRKFLEDPFEYQANETMCFEGGEDLSKLSMEPVEWNRLQSSAALKDFVAKKLGIPEDENNVIDKDILRLRGSLPLGEYGEKVWNDLQISADSYAEQILRDSLAEGGKFSSESFEVNIPRSNGSCWTLIAKAKLVKKTSSGTVTFYDVTEGSASVSKFLSNYIAALGMIAGELTDFPVDLRIYDGKLEPMGYKISRTKEEAVDLLNAMYDKMFVEKFRKIVPISLLAEKFANPYELNNKLMIDRGAWAYFAGKKMFDAKLKEVSGYSDRDNRKFATEWLDAVKTMQALMPDFAEAFRPKEKSSGKKGKNSCQN